MNLIAHYPLDDATDKSGNGLHFTDGTCSFAAGKIGNAAHFDGASDVLYRTSLDALSVTLPWSICFWLYRANTQIQAGRCLSNTASNSDKISLQHYTNITPNQFRATLYDGDTLASASGDLPKEEWHHITLTWNGSDELKLYFDGVLQTGELAPATTGDIGYFFIGSKLPTISAQLDGAMDDVRIYGGVLPLDQIVDIVNYSKGTEKYDPSRKYYGGTQQRIGGVA